MRLRTLLLCLHLQAAATVAYAALAPSLVRDLAVTAAAPSPATPGPWEQGSSLPTSIPAGHGEGEDGDMPGSGPGQGKSKRAGSSTGAVPQQPHTAVLIRADEQGQAAAGGAYAYLEDCAESVPSYLARDPKAAAALWEVGGSCKVMRLLEVGGMVQKGVAGRDNT